MFSGVLTRSAPPLSVLICSFQCVGVQFFIMKLVELAYLDASLAVSRYLLEGASVMESSKNSYDKYGMEILRTSLGHPLQLCQSTVRCIVSSVHGLDSGTSVDRLEVASRLWAEGISAEYLPHSGVMSSLLRQQREETQGAGSSVSLDSIRIMERLEFDPLNLSPLLCFVYVIRIGLLMSYAVYAQF